MSMSEIEGYIADEIRKEVNGANNRRFTSMFIHDIKRLRRRIYQ